MKTRYAKPFESVQVKIPYEEGMNPYSGLVDLFEGKGLLAKEGNSLVYTLVDGTIIKKFRKAWERNEDVCLDRAMADFVANPHHKTADVEELEAVVEAIVDAPVKNKTKKEETAE
jgi:hypothetical protein